MLMTGIHSGVEGELHSLADCTDHQFLLYAIGIANPLHQYYWRVLVGALHHFVDD
jgi:hypothetical protein